MNYGLTSVSKNSRLWLKVFLDPTMETGPKANSPRDEDVVEKGDPGLKVDSVCDGPFPAILGFQPAPIEAIVPEYLGGAAARSRYTVFRYRAGR